MLSVNKGYLELEVMTFCPCESVPLSLLRRGLFPSTPTFPTLAVDVTMLEFVRELFVNSSPNTTAWCDTLEQFLRSRKYKLETQVCLKICSIHSVSETLDRTVYDSALAVHYSGTHLL